MRELGDPKNIKDQGKLSVSKRMQSVRCCQSTSKAYVDVSIAFGNQNIIRCFGESVLG